VTGFVRIFSTGTNGHTHKRIRQLFRGVRGIYLLKAQTQANDPELRNIEKLESDLFELQQLVLVTQPQRVIYTWKARLGFACKTVLLNELVCIIHGSKTHIVLRRSGGNFVFVEQCYLEDAMHGEAVTLEEEEADTFLLSKRT
jgi:hypothetical protein